MISRFLHFTNYDEPCYYRHEFYITVDSKDDMVEIKKWTRERKVQCYRSKGGRKKYKDVYKVNIHNDSTAMLFKLTFKAG